MSSRRSTVASPRPWQRRSDARPAELRSAALRLFAEKGYGGAPVEDIAAAAGVTVGTVYRYFSDKEALFRSLVDWVVTIPMVEPADPAPGIDPSRELTAILTRIWTGSRREPHREMLRVLMAESGNEPALVERYRSAVLGPLERSVAEVLTRAGVADPVATARATLGAVLGASLLAGSGAGAEPLIAQLSPTDVTLAMIARGALGGRPAGAEASSIVPPAPRSSPRYSGPESW